MQPGENFARIAAATVGARLVSMLVNYTLENLLSQYDCLVVVEPDRAEQRMLQKHFGVDGSAVVLQKMELGEPDASGRRSPIAIPGATETIDIDMAIVSVVSHGSVESTLSICPALN